MQDAPRLVVAWSLAFGAEGRCFFTRTLTHSLHSRTRRTTSGLHRVGARWTKGCPRHQVPTPLAVALDLLAFECCNNQHDRHVEGRPWTASGYMTSLLSCYLHVCPSSLPHSSLYSLLVISLTPPGLHLKTRSRQPTHFVKNSRRKPKHVHCGRRVTFDTPPSGEFGYSSVFAQKNKDGQY
jgi:hypothetical protein